MMDVLWKLARWEMKTFMARSGPFLIDKIQFLVTGKGK